MKIKTRDDIFRLINQSCASIKDTNDVLRYNIHFMCLELLEDIQADSIEVQDVITLIGRLVHLIEIKAG